MNPSHEGHPFAQSPLLQQSRMFAQDDEAMLRFTAAAAARVNSNTDRNTYLHLADVAAQAETLPQRFPDPARRPLLYGLPVSLKDCFDLAGTVTTAGSRYFAEDGRVAEENSWVVERLLASGAVIVGKTHLQELAWGITGENPWFGDCLQPRDARQLTGGSSSGAAASVQEGSAVAAIGTDTGGSVRAPAAFCGLCGLRASLGVGDWRGGAHLAPSFDTLGWLFRDLRDAPLLAAAVLGIAPAAAPAAVRVAVPEPSFFHDCEAEMLQRLRQWTDALRAEGHRVTEFSAAFWDEAWPIFSGIQAHEAAALYRGLYDKFGDDYAERFRRGASLSEADVARLRERHAAFVAQADALFATAEYLLLPSTPVAGLQAGADQSKARPRILRYTTPISLGGYPVVALPGGMQLVAPRGADAQLLAFAATLHAVFVEPEDAEKRSGAGEGI